MSLKDELRTDITKMMAESGANLANSIAGVLDTMANDPTVAKLDAPTAFRMAADAIRENFVVENLFSA